MLDLVTVTARELGGGGAHVLVGAAPRPGASPPRPAEATTERRTRGRARSRPSSKSCVWGVGAFLVFLLAMRLFLVPKMRRGHGRPLRQDPRRSRARRRRSAPARKARSPSTRRRWPPFAAEARPGSRPPRRTLEAERTARLADANAAHRRAAQRRRGRGGGRPGRRRAAQVEAAVVDVASRAAELATGQRPDDATVRRIAGEVLGAGVSAMMLGIIMLAAEEHIDQTHEPDLPRGLRDAGPLGTRLDHRLRPAVLEVRAARQEGDGGAHRRRSRPSSTPARQAETDADAEAAQHPPGEGRHRRPSAPACWPRPTSPGRGAARRRPRPARARGRRARRQAAADIAAAASRSADELRSEIARCRPPPSTTSSPESLDDATQQR